jgi:transposase
VLSLGGTQRIFLCLRPVDFRKAHDGLCAVVRDQFADDPFSGDLFVFHNGAKDRVKLLLWDKNGFWLLYKRLEKGRFPFAVRGDSARVEIDRAELSMLLEGIDWRSAKRASHYARAFAIKGHHGSRARTPP